MKFIHVIALGDGTVPFRDELGRLHPGRAMGRGADGKPAAELVADTTYVRRALGRSELAVVEPEEPPAATPEPAAAPALAVVTTDAPLVIQRGIAADDSINRTEP